MDQARGRSQGCAVDIRLAALWQKGSGFVKKGSGVTEPQ